MLLFMPILGIAISLTTIVGMFYGAKEYKKLLSVVYYGINRAVIITTISVILFFSCMALNPASTKIEVLSEYMTELFPELPLPSEIIPSIAILIINNCIKIDL